MSKQTATFSSFEGYEAWADGRTAILFGVSGHPKLGNVPRIYTSLIEKLDDEENPTVIETRNTIYTKE